MKKITFLIYTLSMIIIVSCASVTEPTRSGWTAKNKGLKDEDRVCIESRYGKTEGKLRVSELIHPDVIGIPGNYGGKSASFLNPVTSEAAWYNALLSSEEAHSLDPITAGIENAPKVKIYKVE